MFLSPTLAGWAKVCRACGALKSRFLAPQNRPELIKRASLGMTMVGGRDVAGVVTRIAEGIGRVRKGKWDRGRDYGCGEKG